MIFNSVEHLQDELSKYLYYYNYQRSHQGINRETPVEFLKNLSTNQLTSTSPQQSLNNKKSRGLCGFFLRQIVLPGDGVRILPRGVNPPQHETMIQRYKQFSMNQCKAQSAKCKTTVQNAKLKGIHLKDVCPNQHQIERLKNKMIFLLFLCNCADKAH